MSIDAEVLMQRKVVWEMAAEMIDPVVEKHGLERVSSSSGSPIFGNSNSTFTAVDQHLGAIEQVANWLLGVE